ncbi:MAG: DUF956 family protein [Limosilactobacillus fermentum]|uniref:DUF956 family protein n=1 Tax=Limosilactobacillus fermentum TaxID=1613 RepID=UPI000975EB96|nr:DUF956 family protein [Limosilactobacillus fermentum]MBS6067693.1 DUF956 family protein [Limosilactobacillus fermentum]MCH5389717.1 DUF956 family protein [Limosilactobacillus fermentum]MCH5394254.1 DUF956 family protein [Limosilactobacillus fermentum]MCJ2388979.1 DUF956 family protein [Limosilactobacillus fermentum]MCT3434727.1 DUF956 family protein [Limosilactobacillus fermentum]
MLNEEPRLVMPATSFLYQNSYGNIVIGDGGFEYFDSKDRRKFVEIPWNEVDYVMVSVFLKGHWIPRFQVVTKKNGGYIFAAKEPKKLLKLMQDYVPKENFVKPRPMFKRISGWFKH